MPRTRKLWRRPAARKWMSCKRGSPSSWPWPKSRRLLGRRPASKVFLWFERRPLPAISAAYGPRNGSAYEIGDSPEDTSRRSRKHCHPLSHPRSHSQRHTKRRARLMGFWVRAFGFPCLSMITTRESCTIVLSARCSAGPARYQAHKHRGADAANNQIPQGQSASQLRPATFALVDPPGVPT